MSRRNMLKGIGIAGAAIAVSPAVLAACGDDSGSSAATTAGGGGAATTGCRRCGDHRGGRDRRRRGHLGQAARDRRGDLGCRHGLQDGQRARAHGQRVLLRQDHDPRHRPCRRAHQGCRWAEHHRQVLRPQVRRRRGRQAGHHRARRSRLPREARVLRRRPRGDARGHRAVQDVHARRRRRHQHLRPGPAVLLGHPRDHAERSDAGSLQVDEGEVPRRQDDGADGLGHRRAEQQQHQGRRPEEDRGRRLRVQRPLRAVPGGHAGLQRGAPEDHGQRARHPALRRLRPGSRVVRQPVRHGWPEGDDHRLRVHS